METKPYCKLGMIKRSYQGHLAELERLARDLEEFCDLNGIGAPDLFQLNLCLDEAVTNIISHGYNSLPKPDPAFEVRLELKDAELHVELTDRGAPYDPLKNAPEPDLTSAPEDREIGGLGVHFMKKTMDQLQYERTETHNVLKMVKKISF